MKSRSVLIKFLIFGSPLLFLAFLFGFRQLRHDYLYPMSSEFINPYNGRPDPEFAKYVLPLTLKKGDLVDINIGDSPSDVTKLAVMQYLSPIIRMYPDAKRFHVIWGSGEVWQDVLDLRSWFRVRFCAVIVGAGMLFATVHGGQAALQVQGVWSPKPGVASA